MWDPSNEQLQQFIELQSLLREWNELVNLTRLLEGDEFWISQVFDSLWPLREELKNPNQLRKCIDVGTGCGLPGIAVAIALPSSKITLIDAAKRKTSALSAITASLGLTSQISIKTERVEVVGQDPIYRGQFDLAMARAVASAPVVAEYLIPLLKPEGEALIYRGQWNSADERILGKALITLQGKINKIHECELPNQKGIRHLIRIGPKATCPSQFPRKIGIPAKRPLGY